MGADPIHLSEPWSMKAEIHPEYVECTVTCGCGNTFTTRSTKDKINVEICSECHPFYTGQQRFVDTAGRIEIFNRRFAQRRPAAKKKSDDDE